MASATAALVFLLGCQKDGAVRTAVEFGGFHPGCLEVEAIDAADPSKSATVTKEVEAGARSGTWTVAVFRGQGWGRELELVAIAREQTCQGKVVARKTARVLLPEGSVVSQTFLLEAADADEDGFVDASAELPGSDCDDDDAAVRPGVVEVCDGQDNNCDGSRDEGSPRSTYHRDQDGDGHGDPDGPVEACVLPEGYVSSSDDCDDLDPARFPGANEVCDAKDNDCDGQTDEDHTLSTYYQDEDGDGYGNSAKQVVACAQPAGAVTQGKDCDDGAPQIHPQPNEPSCDGVDDDCDGSADEDFNVGQACTVYDCAGTLACDPSNKTTTRCDSPPPTAWYPDGDGDGQGSVGGKPLPLCGTPPSGYVANATDCNDGNPYIAAGLAERCDELDNDCNPQTGEVGVCPSGAAWTQRSDMAGVNWKTLSVWGKDRVWFAGVGNRLRHLDSGTMHDYDGHCSGDWYVSWVRPSDGRVWLAGKNGKLAQHAASGNVCESTLSLPSNAQVAALTGFELASGTEMRMYGQSDGTTTRVDVSSGGITSSEKEIPSLVIRGMHGHAPTKIFAVGESPQGSRIYRYNGSSWQESQNPSVSNLNDVFAVGPQLAFAVGDQGAVLRYDGASWTMLSAPAPVNLTAVRGFGASLAYATDMQGNIWRWDGAGWTTLYTEPNNSPLRDLDGTAPDDLWAVGDNGVVVHWPGP